MRLTFNTRLVKNYTSSAQIVRVLTESWVKENSYCPNCGRLNLEEYANNKPVADFYCTNCKEDYELKSKNGNLTSRIVDGAYSSMINRITSDSNPNFFFLTYNKSNWNVNNFLIIPKHFFVPQIIERRKPLSDSARRAGWIGCNIDISKIPTLGQVFLVKNSKVQERKKVLENWRKTLFLKDKTIETRGWTLDILNCIDKIMQNKFTLSDVYRFEMDLKKKHPNNNFIKDKIRQQLQVLRDKSIIEFNGKGNYSKL